MYIPYPPSSYSGITSMIHMKLGEKRFAKTVPKWTWLKLGGIVLQERVALGKKSCRSSQIL